ncbi:choice-of-anchor D domain-containing protein [uncultured Winogradskyella sp.]|uniref:choice-of-anchor D domain-containing protein n=1 Tax=uncultured Winogradskyella sp. TaxID=395353 RepID=UPI002619EE98|nr:choice-of-anchor D domain-containing protein [uncultured Winogradskyella sp.]
MIKNYFFPLILICFAVSLGYGQVSNGDFESWTGSTPDNWTTIDAGITTAEETTIVHGGSSSASINVTTGTQASTDLRQTIPLINGDNYTVSCWVRHTEGNMRARLYVDGYEGYSANGNTSTWQEITYTFTATSTSIEVGLRFYDQTGFDGAEIVYVDDFTIINNSAPSTTTVQFSTVASTVAEDGLFFDVCASISNPSATLATTVDITLNGSSTAINGTDYDDGAGVPAAISFPQTITFPANSSADVCFTFYISNDDTVIEGDETVVLNLINPTGGDSASINGITTHTVTITDNDYYDSCLTSTNIPVNSSCTTQSFTNVGATDSGVTDPGCGSYGGGDAWFNLIVPTSGAVTVETSNNGGITDSGLALYSGSCGSLTLIECDDDDGDGNMSMISASGLTPGSTIYVRVWEYNNNDFDTFNLCAYSANEIDVERNTYASIANGNAANTGNNTIFASTEVGTATPPVKTYYIRNEGSADLNVSSITSSNAAEFSISTNPVPLTLAPGALVAFDIEFSPTNTGTRNGTITIVNNDSDENPYTFGVQGEGICAAGSFTISPASGPVETIVTVTGTNLATATASFNGLAATVNNISATKMEVTVPVGATSGSLEISDSLGCPASTPFTVIDSQITSCEGNTGVVPTDLFISEVTDATYGGLSYVELYNGTGSPINIDNYSLEVIANGDPTASALNIFDLENVIVPSGSTYVIAIGRQSPVTTTNACTTITGGSGELASSANAQFSSGGINKKTDQHDVIRLVNTGTTIDEFGVYLDDDWMDSTIITGDRGFNFRRSNTATQLPDPTFTLAELSNWIVIDWVGDGASSCSGNDYSDIGLFSYSTGVPPTVNTHPMATAFACAFSASFTISGAEGYNAGGDTQELAYQWFYNVPGSATWSEILAGNTDYSGQQSATLSIPNTFNFDGYQYYCQLREDTATCFEASNAVKLEALSSTWDGTSWSTPPSLNRAIIIDGDYDTSVGTNGETSFSGCSLIVNAGYELQISNATYIEIENDITADGDITVFTEGSVVQNNDLATVTANGNITVQKFSTMINTPLEYTYWSSPVSNETVENVFSGVPVGRRFIFDASNFVDILIETGNTGVFTNGQDDIDDDGNDWQYATGSMVLGRGYAATANSFGPPLPTAQQYTFSGAFNNGVITPPVVYVPGSPYKDWNLIGNPYPSAIDTGIFFAQNAGIVNTIYLWSHATPENANASGSQGYNFSASDYAIISGSGVNTAGGDLSLIPDNFVPSGQGFFIETLNSSNVVFNNSMRVTGNNDQFFRSENFNRKVLWLNLTSDNGIAKQIAIAHLDGATDSYDGSYYDVTENKSSRLAATFYSIIEDNSEEQFVIQGKDINSLDLNEVIPLGFKTIIDVETLYTISIAQFEGVFYTDNNIYIKDNLLNITHNLKASNYTFTSETGEFNERFEIVFTTNALSINDAVIDANTISIVELANDNVEFRTNSKQVIITNVEILDVLGRRIYNLKGNSSTEVYNLNQLSQAAYIAKVTLSNGQVISKKAIKK